MPKRLETRPQAGYFLTGDLKMYRADIYYKESPHFEQVLLAEDYDFVNPTERVFIITTDSGLMYIPIDRVKRINIINCGD